MRTGLAKGMACPVQPYKSVLVDWPVAGWLCGKSTHKQVIFGPNLALAGR
jgi:hypothetical protein